MKRTRIVASVLLGAALVLTFAPAPAGAKRGDVRVVGQCTKASVSNLKLSEEDGRIEVEFEVDQNRVGVRWTVTVHQNGARIARLVRTTRPPSGSFEARVMAPDTQKADVFAARASSPTREVCTARAGFE